MIESTALLEPTAAVRARWIGLPVRYRLTAMVTLLGGVLVHRIRSVP